MLLGVLAASAFLAVPAATAKDFGPGDLRVCNASRCVAIVKPDVLPYLGSFYYSGQALRKQPRPPLRVPFYELRFRNNYVTGIVATRQFDRFLSYGVNLGRFARGAWDIVPRPFMRELRRLTVGLRPLTRAALARSR
jgi:hypothetical protein